MSDPHTPSTTPSSSRLPKPPLVVVAGAVGTLIGIVSIVVPLVVVGTTPAATTDTVAVTSQESSQGGAGLQAGAPSLDPVTPELANQALGLGVSRSIYADVDDFAVPVDAPWAELWAAGASNECTTEAQLEWLHTYGTVIPAHTITAEISNTAASGSEITVSDIRPQGELSLPAGDTVTVAFYACIGAGDEGVYAHMTLGVDPVAVFDDCYASMMESCYFGTGQPPVPGNPVVFPVRPGETRLLHLTYDQVVDFRGRFVATVEVDGQRSTIDLSPGGAEIVAPVVTRTHPRLMIAAALADTSCTPEADDPAATIEACTLEQWLAILEQGE